MIIKGKTVIHDKGRKDAADMVDSILAEYGLCNDCLKRFFPKISLRKANNNASRHNGRPVDKRQSTSMECTVGISTTTGNNHNISATQSRSSVPAPLASKCHICKDLFENLDHILNMMYNASTGYDFETFGIGAILKHSTVDRDDHIRSKYRLKGRYGIKTGITKELTKRFAIGAGRRAEMREPDITLTVDLRNMSCALRSKSAFFFGRYVKSSRDLPQKQQPCTTCSGNGCKECAFHGISKFDSIEGIISKYLFDEIGGTVTRFTWIGGEDISSLVMGTGRPFFVRVQNPLRRKIHWPPRTSSTMQGSTALQEGPVKILELRSVTDHPRNPIKFTSLIKIEVSIQPPGVRSSDLRKLKTLQKSPIIVYDRTSKRTKKKIFSAMYKKKAADRFVLTIMAEGGLPVKRLISGEDVVPSVSQILGTACTCVRFDFLNVQIKQ